MSILSSFWNLFSSVVQWKLRSWDNLEFTMYLVEIDIYRFQYSNHFKHCLFWFKVLKTKDALKLAIAIPIEKSPGITSNTLSCICSWLFRELCFCVSLNMVCIICVWYETPCICVFHCFSFSCITNEMLSYNLCQVSIFCMYPSIEE